MAVDIHAFIPGETGEQARTYLNTNFANIIAELLLKAAATTTLAGYWITDAYTKTEVDSALSWKATDSAVVHKDWVEQIGNWKSFYDIININSVWAWTNSIVRYYNTTKNWYVWLRGDTSNNWSIADDTDFRFVVQTGGNVGIWTTNPTEKLHVVWSVRSDWGIIVWNASWATAWMMRWNGTKFQWYTGSAWVDFH